MMGRDHALSGALVFAALATTLHVSDAHLAAGVALCAGAGVLPDIDHQDTSISSSFAGVVTIPSASAISPSINSAR